MIAPDQKHEDHERDDKSVGRPFLKQRLHKVVIVLALVVIAGPPLGLCMFRSIPPPGTPLMMMRSMDGKSIQQKWVNLSKISPNLRAAVIASEDNLFCSHYGVDTLSLRHAYWAWRKGSPIGGGSTISMQTTKNLFLWLGKNPIRKMIELYGTAWMEVLWPKHRIMEVYLNIAEWGPQIFGAEAASQHYFNKSASKLSQAEASRLAAILPNPLHLSAKTYSPRIWGRAKTIRKRIRQLGQSRFSCVIKEKSPSH